MRARLPCFAVAAAVLAACQQPVPSAAPGAIAIDLFEASPTSFRQTQLVTFHWKTRAATHVSLSLGGAELHSADDADAAEGTVALNLDAGGVATLTATAKSASASREVTLTLVPSAHIVELNVPESPCAGADALLTWKTENATSVTLSGTNLSLHFENEPAVADGSAAIPPEASEVTLEASDGETTDRRTATITRRPAPTVSSFTVTPRKVVPGGTAAIAWTVSAATSLSLTADTGSGPVALDLDGKRFDRDTLVVTALQSTHFELKAGGDCGTTVASVDLIVLQQPQIDAFTVVPERILRGESATLTWQTNGAAALALQDGTTALDVAGKDPAADTLVVTPATAGVHRFQLTATADPELAFAASATATLTVYEPPVITAFASNKAEVGLSEAVTLSWATSNATAIALRDGANPIVLPGKSAASDSIAFPSLPEGRHAFVLTASHEGGGVDSAPVVVEAFAPPEITSFTASPTTVIEGQPLHLAWTTHGARLLQLADGAAQISLAGKDPSNDSLDLQPTLGAHRYQLTATNPGGIAPSTVIDVVVQKPAPAFTSFTVTPQSVTPGSAVTLAWATTNATDVYVSPYLRGRPMTHSTGGAFEDIAATGTLVPGLTADDAKTTVNLPSGFVFPFLETQATQLTVCTNGWIGFSDPAVYTLTAMFNDPIPTTYTPNNLLAVFWDDLAPKAAGRVYTQVKGAAPDRRFIVQWTDYSYSLPSVGSQLTFQAVLFESGAIELRYLTLSGGDSYSGAGASASIGLEDETGSFGYQVSYNRANAVQSGTSIRFLQRLGGASGSVSLTLPLGRYPFTLTATGPGGSTTTAPTALTVGLTPAIINFIADRQAVGAGDAIKLSWMTANATTWALDYDGVAVPAVPQQPTAANVAFSATTSGTLTLRASNASGGVASATVAISVGAPTLVVTTTPAGPFAAGDRVLVSWISTAANSLTLTGPGGAQLALTDPADRPTIAAGSYSVTLAAGTNSIAVSASNGTAVAARTLTLSATSNAVITRFTASPQPVTEGEPLTFAFGAANATQVALDVANGSGPQPAGFPMTATTNLRDGQFTAPALASGTTYRLTATGPGGPVSQTLTPTVHPRPSVTSFTAAPTHCNQGDPVTLAWSTQNAASATLRTTTGQVVRAGLPTTGSLIVNPQLTTTYVVSARNSAGVEVASAPVTVTVATTQPVLDVTAAPTRIVRGGIATLSWATSGYTAVSVSPVPVERRDGGFIDISATGVALSLVDSYGANTDSGHAVVALPSGFRFAFYGGAYSSLWVSANGWLGFASNYSSSYNTNADLPSPSSAPLNAIAPFWDDLKGIRSDAAVYYEVRGAAPNRTVIVQWTNWSIYTVTTPPPTRLTFEVLLHEGGEVELQYLRMEGAATAAGSSATIGFQNAQGTSGTRLFYNQADAVAAGTGFAVHLAALPLAGSVGLSPTVTTTYTVTATNGTASANRQVTIQVPLAPGDIQITELMIDPQGLDGQKQWIELRNLTGAAIDLTGMEIAASAGSHTIAAASPVLLAASSHGVLAQSSVAAENGGLSSVLYAYRDPGVSAAAFAMNHVADTVTLSLAGTLISSVSWDTSAGWTVAEGRSLQLDGTVQKSRDRSFWCGTPGTAVDAGSPGAVNAGCYQWSVVPGAFVTLAGTAGATTQITSTFGYLNGVSMPFPFAWFGRSATTVNLTTNGAVSFSPLNSSNSFNYKLPSTSAPADLIAPLWDSYYSKSGAGTPAVMTGVRGVAPNRQYVIEWVNYSRDVVNGSSLPVQLILGESGSIEFQYGNLTTADSLGQTSSVGLQVGPGDFALSYLWRGAPQLLTPNTGLRLVKAP